MILLLVLRGPPAIPAQEECAPCHTKIYDSYRRTGMARSFYRAVPGAAVTDFYNSASDTHYAMGQRDGRLYQRRWQIGFDGKETNSEEVPVDYVMGSGNHARTYLTRTTRNTLLQLPLGWYSEKGGYWGVNPGYDTLHPPSHRPIAYECMFCHNAYPQIQAGQEPVYTGTLPEGIDCQRCHGPGAKHIAAAKNGKQIAGTIVNPRKLSKERQMEVCMQCHLETASTRLPALVRRFGPGPFSYSAGQPLADFVLSFDHAPGRGHEDKFEIAGGAYRLRQSRCFLKSKGELTCGTCHDPHDIPRGAEATQHYTAVCRQCHAGVDQLTAAAKHPSGADCVTCHMPKRRTDDAVHVVMTDHLIERNLPSRDLLAELPESHPAASREYKGEVVPYYPATVSPLYLALAQIQHGSNLESGIRMMTAALARAVAPQPEFYMALGDAWHKTGDSAKAAAAYRQALKLQPNSEVATRHLGAELHDPRILQRATQLDPSDAQAWFELGLVASDLQALQRANALDPDLPDVWNALGVKLNSEDAFRQAIRIDPYYATANGNLARLLASGGDLTQALYYFDKAARLQPSGAVNLYEYALTLVQMNRFGDSQREVEAAVEADPTLAEAHELLGGLLARKKEPEAALREYREAVRLKPGFSRAQLDLAATLAANGSTAEALVHFREAAKSPDARIADPATRALRQLGGLP